MKFLLTALILSLTFAKDFLKPVGFINDFADVIPERIQLMMGNIAKEVESLTTAEIAVVTLSSIGEDMTIERYAVDLFEKWGIGKKGKDNGVLILLGLKERSVRIEVGYGLEGILPDGLCGEIIRTKMLPYFRKGEFGTGLFLAVATIGNIIAKSEGKVLSSLKKVPTRVYHRRRVLPFYNLLPLMFLFLPFFGRLFFPLLFFPFVFGRRGYWSSGYGGFGGGFGGFGGGISGGGGATGRW